MKHSYVYRDSNIREDIQNGRSHQTVVPFISATEEDLCKEVKIMILKHWLVFNHISSYVCS